MASPGCIFHGSGSGGRNPLPGTAFCGLPSSAFTHPRLELLDLLLRLQGQPLSQSVALCYYQLQSAPVCYNLL